MSGHTPGRLTVRGGYSIYADDGKTPVADACLTNSIPANDEANARRLVACWNWCEGQDTDGLALSVEFGRTAKHCIDEACAKELELIAQRDELLAELDKANASRIAAQTENESLKAWRAASGVAERRAVRDAVLAEREACAKVCHDEGIYQQSQKGNAIMADKCWFMRDEIRARAAIAKVEQP